MRIADRTRNDSGQGMVEYGLILALISVLVVGVMTTTGTNMSQMLNYISATIAT